jgi:ABC-type transport system involved in cytochrome c biogenesis permease subunit
MKKSFLKGITAVFLLLAIGSAPAYAQAICPLGPNMQPRTIASMDKFKDIPIIHQGRIKPVDTYARALLLQYSGRTSFNRRPAVEWLARLLFAPATTLEDKVLLINNPEIAEAMGVEPEPKRRYSFSQLEPGFAKLEELARLGEKIEEKERTIVEREILRLYHNVLLYIDYAKVFMFAMPSEQFRIDDQDIITEMNLTPGQNLYSFFDIISRADILEAKTRGLERGNREQWSDQNEVFFNLTNTVFHWSMFYRELPFNVVPTAVAGKEGWLSPQDAINEEFHNEAVREEIGLLRDLVVHYWNGDQMPFDFAVRSFMSAVGKRISPMQKKAVDKLPLELFYSKADLFLWAKIFYGLAFSIFLLSFFVPGPLMRKIALGTVVVGFLPHLLALILRIIIMARPPVSNLYETFIFVSLITVILGVILEMVHRRWVGILVASVGGLVFLLIAAKFAAEGDTLQMLVAVLNSNFWLGTHVISITIGYAACCVAGLIGHFYILQCIKSPGDKALLDSTHRNLVGALGFGLMMAFLGTTLGGIWADQSWGRFWGWDPKENGALLIVLWCAIIFHAKVGRFVGPLGFAVGSSLGIIVVMWAWFGVNLLSIGLHSYGFMSGVSTGLLLYVICEIVFLSISVPVAQKKLMNAKQANKKPHS